MRSFQQAADEHLRLADDFDQTQFGEAVIRQMDISALPAQGEIERQPTEHIEAAACPGDEDVLAVGKLVKDGQIELHGKVALEWIFNSIRPLYRCVNLGYVCGNIRAPGGHNTPFWRH